MTDQLLNVNDQINISDLLKQNEDIVISGIGCRFPMSNNTDEFAKNLFDNIDMITEDDNEERWPKSLYGMNNRMGRIKDIDKFDGSFFGFLDLTADEIEPEARILLEKTYEAIVDAGLNPQQLYGTNTGVYIGQNEMAMPDGYPEEVQTDSRKSMLNQFLWMTGTAKNVVANRISYAFNFNGPSLIIDSACSSSSVAFDLAVTHLLLGKCDMAIVGTSQINIKPFTNFLMQANHINSVSGISRVWDDQADGFVRSEAIACVLLQKKSQAKRIYATVIYSKNNADGYKKNGYYFPSKELQQRLMEQTYTEAGLDPNEMNYLEAHGIGTPTGDPEEAKAIASAYCKNRKGKLLIGLLKSNIGYGQGTSGLASITKAIISFEHKCIPANLNLKNLRSSIAQLCPPLEPVNQNTPFEPNYCGINSFGIGGVNAHIILKANKKEFKKESFLIADKIPRLINFCGRTQEAVDDFFDFVEKNPSKITRDFLALINSPVKYTSNTISAGFPFRGSIIIKQKQVNENETIDYNYYRETSKLYELAKPVWFFFSGMGSQWIGMAKAMMAIDKFAQTIKKCNKALKQLKVDLFYILLSDDETALNSTVKPFIAITAIQIALFEVLKELDIEPDKIIGHSFGEIACAYADGCLTLQQAMLCSYWRGKVVEDSNVPSGKVAAVGLSWEEAVKRCPENVYVACDNACDLVTISGLEDDMIKFMDQLKSENVFVREVVGYKQKPCHSEHLNPVADIMTTLLKALITRPKRRSSKWLSTSVPIKNWEDELAQYASAEYFVNSFINPVLFTSTLSQAPSDAIVIEIAPHALFAGLIKRTLKDVNYIGLMKRNNNQQNLEMFISSLGKLYQAGLNPSIEKLYPKVEWPVARGTQSISSLIKWDHRESYLVKKFPEYFFPSTASDLTFEFSLDYPDDAFLQDHVIDGKPIFPAAGYLMLAWRRLAAQKGLQWNQVPVVFENVQFRRTVLFQNGKVKLTVRYIEPTGEFVVLESGHVACFGKVFADMKHESLQLQHLIKNINSLKYENSLKFNHHEFYRESKMRGYDYGPKFQGVQESYFIDESKSIGKVRYTNNSNFITTLDSMMQLMINAIPLRSLYIPISIESFKCDPLIFNQAVNQHKIEIFKNRENNSSLIDDKEKEILKIDKQKNNEFSYNVKKLVNDIREKTETEILKWNSDFTVLVDKKLKAVIAKGIELRGQSIVNVPRRCLSNGLRLEKYEFIPHYEDDAIESYNRNEIMKYLDVCSAICKQILDKAESNPKNNISNDLTNVKIDQKAIDEMTMNINEEHTLLNSLYNVLHNHKDFNNNIEFANDLRQKSEKLEFDVSKDIINLIGRNERLIRPLIDIVNENVTPIKQLKVLEINTTNGIIGVDILQMLNETFIVPVAIEYTIVHKNPEKIKEIKELENIGGCNIVEWIHYNTDFPESINHNFNLIIHRDSFQLWNIDLNNYFNSTLKMLNENGFLLAVFRSKMTAPEIILNQFKEEDLPNENQLINRIEIFEKTAIENGLKLISKKTDSLVFAAVLFRKINQQINPNLQTIVEVKCDRFEEWLNQLKKLIQEHKSKDTSANIWLYANDCNINGILGLTNCLKMESGGDKLKCIFDLDNKLPKKIDFNVKPFDELLKSNLVMNVFKDNKFGSFRHLNLPKNYDKIETNSAYADVGQIGDLSSLQWFDGRKLKNFLIESLFKDIQQKDIKVDIYYSSLNFRDVMLALKRISFDAKFIECPLGLEFTGRRCDTGERVIGISTTYGIATENKTYEPLLLEVPDQWSMEDAATVYTVYMTCWYGLIEKGQLQQGETILIHCGAGGVGQAAINICQYYKCKIFTTVSTQEKRDFLKRNYRLTDEQIFNSRNTDFEEKVSEATNGEGVDLVLNSLAEEKLLASFRCVGVNGRFIQIGKYHFQINNPLQTYAFLKNISFHGIALDQIFSLQKKYSLNIFKKFEGWFYNGVKTGFVKPLNRTIFKTEELKDAFNYMMTGKHIGKVLIKIRDEEPNRKPLKAKSVQMNATTKTWFDSEKAYIIIGGLGGMGLEMVYWMMLRGAQKFVLTSRSGIKTNYQKVFLKKLYENEKRIQVKISTQNVINEQQAKNVLNEAESMGKIGGIFQLAVVLNDALFENQTVQTFDSVCKPKVDATINLDKLSRQLHYQLDYFVCFSSITSGRGNTGQTPYGYANSVMERICENRRKDGLHGIAIQWGPISDGVFVNTSEKERLEMTGLQMQKLPSWLYVLDKYLQCPYPVLASSIRMKRELNKKSATENIFKQIWSLIGVDPKTVPNHVTLGQVGVESMVSFELQLNLEREFGISISTEEIERITVGDLKEFEKGNKEKIKQLAVQLKTAKEILSKIKFELSNEPITKLNDISTGNPIYLLPPIESIYPHLILLTKLLPFPVYALNWTYEMEQLETIKEIGLHYENLMKTLEPNGNYILLTTNFGSIIALRMAYNLALIKKIFIIETLAIDKASFDLVKEENQIEKDEHLLSQGILNRMLPSLLYEEFQKGIKKIDDEEEKINGVIQYFRRFTTIQNTKDLHLIIKGIMKKAKMMMQFKEKYLNKLKNAGENIEDKLMEKRIKTDLIVIKSKVNIQDDLFSLYGMNKEKLELKYYIEEVACQPEQLFTLNVEKTAQIILHYIK